MTKSRTSSRFHLGAILTVTTGTMLAPDFNSVHELVEHLAGGPVWTHQIPRVCDEAVGPLLAQHPDLAAVDVPEFAEPYEVTVAAKLAEPAARFGEYRDVTPLDPADHARIDPITELADMAPHLPVVAVVVPDQEGGASRG